MTDYKTPGVYIVEKSAFPNSVVEVATAVPVFIGYTADAKEGKTDVIGKPIRITSLRDFESIFGGAPTTELVFDGDPAHAVLKYAGQRYLLYYSMRLFFDNGGGAC